MRKKQKTKYIITKREWKIIIAINILAFLGIIIPFMKGSNFLAPIWFIIFSFLQIAGMFGLFATPVGLIWTAFELIKKCNLNSVSHRFMDCFTYTFYFWSFADE